MTDVTLPDGSIAAFPDSMPQDQIAAAIQAHLAQQNQNLPGVLRGGEDNAVIPAPELPGEHAGKVAGSNLIAGGLDLAGMPGSVLNALPKMAPSPSAPASANEDETAIAQLAASGGGLRLPTSKDLLSGAKDLGIIDQPSQQPRDWGERLLAGAARGVGSTAPLGLFGGPAGILKAGIQGAASGLGGEVGKNYLPVSENPTVSTLAGILAGQGVGGAAFGAVGRGVNAARGVGSPVIEAYDAAGVTPRLAGDVTGRPLLQGMQSMAMRAPFGGRAVRAAEQGANEFANSIENTAQGLGSSRTMTDAGLALQQGARDWMKNWRGQQQLAEAAVTAKVAPNTPVDVGDVQKLLNDLASKMPSAKPIADIMTNPVYNKLSNALNASAAPQYAVAQTLPGGARIVQQTGSSLPWTDMRAWRSAVGDELQNSLLSKDGNQEAWRRLYGSLSGALGDAATKAGAGSEWAAANSITNKGHLFTETTLSDILNHPGAQNTVRPEDAAQVALNGAGRGGSTLQMLRQEMPQASDELAAFKLRQMATATAGKQTQEAPVSATTFSTQLNSLSPEARRALFSGIEPKLSALQTVAERGKDTFAHYGNPSGTGGNLQHAGLLTAPIVIGEAARGGHDIGGLPGAVAAGSAAAAPYLAGPIASNLTARETLARYLAAPTGGPGAGVSRLYRAAGAWPSLQPLIEGERAR